MRATSRQLPSASRIGVSLALTFIAAGSVHSQTILIDDFLVDDRIIYRLQPNGPSGGLQPEQIPNTSNRFVTGDLTAVATQLSPSAIGGSRDISFRRIPSPGFSGSSATFDFLETSFTNVAGNPYGATLSNGVNNDLFGLEIVYDSSGLGLGGVDFSQYEQLRLSLLTDSLGPNSVFEFTMTDTSSNIHVESITFPTFSRPRTVQTVLFVNLEEFSSAGVDLNLIDSIGLSISQGNGADTLLTSFAAIVPEPSNTLYLLLSLMVLQLRVRKNSRKIN